MTEHTPRMIETHGATFTVADEERYREYWSSVIDESWEPETFMVLKGLIEPDSTLCGHWRMDRPHCSLRWPNCSTVYYR